MFSNPRINDRFSCGRSLANTINALQTGSIAVEDIPKITVVRQGDRFITLDHRRLYCFRAALPVGAVIPVMVVESSWLGHRYRTPDAPTYDAVRVETDCLKHA